MPKVLKSTYYLDESGNKILEKLSNKKTTLTDSDTDYPTCKAVKTAVDAKQETNLYYSNVSASTWVADTTYTGYGFKCDLTASGVTSSMYPIVTLGAVEAISGNYHPICNSGTNIVTIYSKVNTTITIPLIKILK